MNKITKRNICIGFVSLLSSSFLASCTRLENREDNNKEVLIKDFDIVHESNIESGGSSEFFVTYKNENLSKDLVTFSVTSGENNVYLEDNIVYFLNTKEEKFTLKASFNYENYDFELEKEYTIASDTTLIRDIKTKAKKGEEYFVRGIVAYKKANNEGGSDGFVLTDGDDSIYVYGSALANYVNVGNKIMIKAAFTYYITSTEVTYAEKFGFDGGKRLEKGSIIENDVSTANKVSSRVFHESTIYDLANASISTNITSNLYKVKAKIKKQEEPGFINYYFFDPKGSGSMYAYSNYNGAEYTSLDKYDDEKYHTVVLMIINAKCQPTGCFYRMIPCEIYDDEYVVTDLDKANGVLIRAKDSFVSNYFVSDSSVEVETLHTDSITSEAKIVYTSSNPEIVEIKNNNLLIKDKVGEVTINIEVTLNDTKVKDSKVITVEEKAKVDTTSIASLYENGKDGETYSIEGVIVDSVWSSGNTKHGAYYLQDSSNKTIIVYPDSENIDTELKKGEKVIFTGTYKFAPEKEGYFDGNRKLNDAKIEFHDGKENSLYKNFEFKKIEEIASILPEMGNSMVGNVYESEFTVKIVNSNYYTNYYLKPITEGETKDIMVYSNGQTSETNAVNFLNEYEGKRCKALIGIRDSKNGSKYRFDVLRNAITVVE